MKMIKDRSSRVISKVTPVQIEAILNKLVSQQLRGSKLKEFELERLIWWVSPQNFSWKLSGG